MANSASGDLTDLAGFPMVLAVSQDEINRKFAELYGEASRGTDTFPHMPWDLKGKGWELVVDAVSAPIIDFDTDIKKGCRLLMTIRSGHFTSMKMIMPDTDGIPDPKDIKIENTTIPLDNVALSVVSTISKVEHEEWSDANFSAEALFMDLTQLQTVEIHIGDDLRIDVTGTQKASLETLLHDHIQKLATKHPTQLLFGGVRLPRVAETTGPFQPTKSAFSTTVNTDDVGNQKASVNFLLCDASIPEIRHSNGAGVFDHCLLHGDGRATLVISDASILEHFVKPALMDGWSGIDLTLERKGLGPDPSKLGYVGDLNFGVTLDGHDRNAYLKRLMVTVKNDRITIEYDWKSSVFHWSSDIDVEVSGAQTVTLAMENGVFTATRHFDKPHVATDDSDLTARVFGDILTGGLDELGRLDTSESGKSDMDTINRDILSNIQPALDSFNLPGGSVLKFESAYLDRHLYVNATYK